MSTALKDRPTSTAAMSFSGLAHQPGTAMSIVAKLKSRKSAKAVEGSATEPEVVEEQEQASVTPSTEESAATQKQTIESGKSAVQQGAAQFIQQLRELARNRENWEQSELAASHARLYGILTQCYQYFVTMSAKETPQNVKQWMKLGLDSRYEATGAKQQKNTHDMTRIVKVVFGNERKRASGYSLVLQAAYAENVEPNNLADWIQKKDGIEAARKDLSRSDPSIRLAKIEKAKDTTQSQSLMTIRPQGSGMLFDTKDENKVVILLATYRPTGELDINSVVRTDAAVNVALRAAQAAKNKAKK